MKKNLKKLSYGFVVLLLMVFMFLKPTSAVEASKTGLMLWFQTIIPTLLPFMILSNLMIQLDMIKHITFFFSPILHRVFHISANGSYAMLIGFLCGYPMGAKTTADMTENGLISLEEGQYLLSFCNNVSPMFIITFIINESLHRPELLFTTLLILYSSPLILALFLNPFYQKRRQEAKPFTYEKKVPKVQINFALIDTCIMNSFENITILGGYIILFAILSGFIQMIPIPAPYLKYAMIGITEITNGVKTISSSDLPFSIQYMMLLVSTSFGGLSSIAQTKSMIQDSGLSLKLYILSKILTAIITLILLSFFLF